MTSTRALALFSCAVFASCTQNQSTSQSASAPGNSGIQINVNREALGEVSGGFPSDQERMLLVLMNQARHSPTTPNNNECGDYTAQVGAIKKIPFVYSKEANQGARFSAKHMADNSCYQNENCCQLGDAGAGLPVGCLGAASCSGAMCAQTCDAGVGQTATQRYSLFGFNSLSGVSISRSVNSAYDLWCQLMMSPGNRDFIYADAGTEFAGGYFINPMQTCSMGYWAMAYGNAAVTSVPKIPAASAMYAPPNPINTSGFYFAANYYDRSGKAPQRSAVVVGGHCFDLDKAYGFDDNGTYETRFPDPDVIPDGCQAYYFVFVDGDGVKHTYPTTGSLQVAIGANTVCPVAYDPAPQLPADCETGNLQCTTGARRPCYTADTNTVGIGECRQGTQQCRTGFWGACRDMVGPFAEACDGLDNNCNGTADEGNPGSGLSCEVEQEIGACRAGARSCVSGRLDCVPTVTPKAEICNGVDDDCDGAIDDGFAQVTCGVGVCYRVSATCVSGQTVTCVPGTPQVEIDDGKDNNCDGQVDEGFSCLKPDGGPSATRQVYPLNGNPSRAPCSEGIQQCRPDGGWGPVVSARIPKPEVCNGEDDDCDGTLDNSREVQVILGYARCGVGACAIQTTTTCSGGTPRTCTPKPPAAEVCNGLDDDCNGTVDENCSCRGGDSRVCYTGPSETREVGVCKLGARMCTAGKFPKCAGEIKPSQEQCNGLDDDCDKMVDDNCLPDAGVDAGMMGAGGGAAGGTAGGMPMAGGEGAGMGGGAAGGTMMPPKGCGCSSNGDLGMMMLAALLLVLRRRAA
jgi:hypothetical protein